MNWRPNFKHSAASTCGHPPPLSALRAGASAIQMHQHTVRHQQVLGTPLRNPPEITSLLVRVMSVYQFICSAVDFRPPTTTDEAAVSASPSKKVL